MSNSYLGGCQPISPVDADGKSGIIRTKVVELTKLNPEEYRGVVIPMVKQLGSSDMSGDVTIRAPATHNLIIDQIFGHVALVNWATETLDLSAEKVGNFSSAPNVRDRLLMKAMNARVQLVNTDRAQNVIDGGLGSLNLAAVVPVLGGRVVDWREAPHVVPSGEQLQLSITLVQNVAGIRGGATEYGLILVGRYVRIKAS